ncbi:hypothetical protein [Noviherbaspirillum saxi]|uniref:Uncharacterized protein n=1 Tax=Noviherbaspirillum saxi TaxID=2320863 RepID=A0A3A3FPH7_9BURK|nr:hypothetical protein [Noviherbaspirillum saxi]RJF97916.1 hypothetical protein D3871_04815 [Noviherbaspirillum saxi]
MPREVIGRVIALYLELSSFEEAHDWGKFMMRLSADFKADHVRHILCHAADDKDVEGSYQLRYVISNLRASRKIPDEELEDLLRQHGLEEYAKKD